MDLQARKYQFIQELFKVERPSVVDKLEAMLRQERAAVTHHTVEQYNDEIDRAVANIENGDFLTQDEAKTAMKRWLE